MRSKSRDGIIISSISGFADSELAEAIQLVDATLNGSYRPISSAIINIMKSESHTNAYKTFAVYISLFARDLSAITSAASLASLARTLLHLREKLAVAINAKPTCMVQRADPEHQQMAQDPLTEAIVKVYQISVCRSPVQEEIDIWKNHFKSGVGFHEFLLGMISSPEAQQNVNNRTILFVANDGEFVQTAYELILGRGAAAWEIDLWRDKLESNVADRAAVLAEFFDVANKFFLEQANASPHDGLSCLVMGTGTHVSVTDWEYKAKQLQGIPPKEQPTRFGHRFHIKGKPRVLVSAIASLYCGGDFIEQFMDNITSQDSFDDFCELVIVDADSPENEYKTIKRYLQSHRNINYIRCNYRIGIYDAWNVAAKAARGEYLTNTNLDDMRRHDSLALQAATLDNLSFVDAVYQDLYYTFDPTLSFEKIALFGLQTTLPVITGHNMIQFNSPHNAPMWRKRLHNELGYFDTHYRSAGDYEFWMRCLAAGKKFYKINDPHVIYYQNPKGLSTRPGTRGLAESMEIHKTYCRKLVPQEVVLPRNELVKMVYPHGIRSLDSDSKDRYVLLQQALRNAARYVKYPKEEGAGK